MLVAAVLTGAVVGALGFRLRGSSLWQQWTGRGATTARLVAWALPLAVLAWLLTPLSWWEALALFVGLYVASVPPWWRSLSLGRNPVDGNWFSAAARHTARGLVWGAGPTLALLLAGGMWWWPLVAGVLVVLPYELNLQLIERVRYPQDTFWHIGELGFGAMLGAATLFGCF